MQFEWDPLKASANIHKHGVTFAEALTVFGDATARIFSDPDHSIGEERELVIGYDSAGQLLVISFVERRGSVRIISARRATSRETFAHETNLR